MNPALLRTEKKILAALICYLIHVHTAFLQKFLHNAIWILMMHHANQLFQQKEIQTQDEFLLQCHILLWELSSPWLLFQQEMEKRWGKKHKIDS